MSSTGRGRKRVEHDYYATEIEPIRTFLRAWCEDAPDARDALAFGPILDPCAGGNKTPVEWMAGQRAVFSQPMPMSYPAALREFTDVIVDTNDIREDSPAMHHEDFLAVHFSHLVDGHTAPPPQLIISNPPFFLAMEFITHALECVADGGFVVFLLRFNFLETEARFPFFRDSMPWRIYVHHKRLCFTGDGKTDSVAYAHMVWRKGISVKNALTRVI